jgi:tRNA threonylcarbamoyladenosine biosynthesis protein TsaB
MPASQRNAQEGFGGAALVLGVDTCGPSGSVALGRLDGDKVQILGQTELAGRSYSATLVAAVGELLGSHGAALKDLRAMVAVNGPGSFTGVRVGLSAVKGLAEPLGIPVAVVSRLAVLARKAGVSCAALDAHRNEVFLRICGQGSECRELLAGAAELSAILPQPGQIAVCDEEAGALLGAAWQGVELARTDAPTAADAMELAVARIQAGDFVDLASLDGHYLRRSDAEIFGEPAATPPTPSRVRSRTEAVIRPMAEKDLDRVLEIAESQKQAPRWLRGAYLAAIDPAAVLRRVALVVEDSGKGNLAGFTVASATSPEAELETIVTATAHQRQGFARRLFAALAGELRGMAVSEVVLEVRASNGAARAFYRALGFVESGRRPRYYAEPIEDAVLMRLRLS